jgi:hypothetical protein
MKYVILIGLLLLVAACTSTPDADTEHPGDIDTTTNPNTPEGNGTGVSDVFADDSGITPPQIPS